MESMNLEHVSRKSTEIIYKGIEFKLVVSVLTYGEEKYAMKLSLASFSPPDIAAKLGGPWEGIYTWNSLKKSFGKFANSKYTMLDFADIILKVSSCVDENGENKLMELVKYSNDFKDRNNSASMINNIEFHPNDYFLIMKIFESGIVYPFHLKSLYLNRHRSNVSEDLNDLVKLLQLENNMLETSIASLSSGIGEILQFDGNKVQCSCIHRRPSDNTKEDAQVDVIINEDNEDKSNIEEIKGIDNKTYQNTEVVRNLQFNERSIQDKMIQCEYDTLTDEVSSTKHENFAFNRKLDNFEEENKAVSFFRSNQTLDKEMLTEIPVPQNLDKLAFFDSPLSRGTFNISELRENEKYRNNTGNTTKFNSNLYNRVYRNRPFSGGNYFSRTTIDKPRSYNKKVTPLLIESKRIIDLYNDTAIYGAKPSTIRSTLATIRRVQNELDDIIDEVPLQSISKSSTKSYSEKKLKHNDKYFKLNMKSENIRSPLRNNTPQPIMSKEELISELSKTNDISQRINMLKDIIRNTKRNSNNSQLF
ncbi:hypothetical protein ACR3K2_10780 [Cryptosporidium serpentis]